MWEIIKLQLTHYRDVCVERETKDTFRDKSFVVKDPNNCFLFSCSPTNWFAAATRSIESVLSLWTWSVMRWFSLASPVVARKYVLTRFKAENERSLAAFVAGITNSNFPSVQISERSNLWGSSIDWKNDIRSSTLNLEVSKARLINRGVLIKLTQSQNNYSNLHFYCSTLVFNIYFLEFAKLLGGPGPPRPLPTLRHW